MNPSKLSPTSSVQGHESACGRARLLTTAETASCSCVSQPLRKAVTNQLGSTYLCASWEFLVERFLLGRVRRLICTTNKQSELDPPGARQLSSTPGSQEPRATSRAGDRDSAQLNPGKQGERLLRPSEQSEVRWMDRPRIRPAFGSHPDSDFRRIRGSQKFARSTRVPGDSFGCEARSDCSSP